MTFGVPPVQPIVFNTTAETLLLETRSLLAKGKRSHDELVATTTPGTATFANTLLPLAQRENARLSERQLIEFYACVYHDERMRKAASEAKNLFARFEAETAQRGDLFSLVAAVRDKQESLNGERQKLLNKVLSESEPTLSVTSEEKTARLTQLDAMLSRIKQEYLETCSQDVCVFFTEDELAGVDQHSIAELERADDGRLRLSFQGMRWWQVLRTATREETRRRIYTSRASMSSGNVGLLEEAIGLREEKALLLGFTHYAEMTMRENMEKSPQKIKIFLDDLLEKMTPLRDAVASSWRQMKRDDLSRSGERDDGKFYEWDRHYYSRKLVEQDCDIDTDTVSIYFELSNTIKRMLKIFEQVFGMRFVHVNDQSTNALPPGYNAETLVWHPDVWLFAVWNDTGDEHEQRAFLGYFYMDLFTRPGKRPGFCDLPVRPPRSASCNTGEVVVIFHELGHGIHDLVGQTEFSRFHGASTAADFNEAPSQMLEQWCWHPSTLKLLSQRYSSPDISDKDGNNEELGNANDQRQLPDDLIEKLIRSRKIKDALKTLAILSVSRFHLAISTTGSRKEAKRLDTTKLFHAITKETLGVDTSQDLCPAQACMAENFTVKGMYIYLITQVYAVDMFASAFQVDPMSREQGLRYRRTVIGKGSSEDEMKMLVEFLGRAPERRAFYKGLGLFDKP